MMRALGQLRNFESAEFRHNPRGGGPIEAINRFATAPEIIGSVFGERIGNGVGAIERRELACLFLSFPVEPRSRVVS